MVRKHTTSHKTMGSRFKLGDFVKLKADRGTSFHKALTPRFVGPFIIDRIGMHHSYYLKKPNGDLLLHPVNANDIAPWISEGGDTVIADNDIRD